MQNAGLKNGENCIIMLTENSKDNTEQHKRTESPSVFNDKVSEMKTGKVFQEDLSTACKTGKNGKSKMISREKFSGMKSKADPEV